MDYHDVAYAVKAKPEKLWKVIKYLASEGIFKVEGDEVSLTPAGHYLKYDREDSMRWCIIHWNEEVAHSMHFMLDEVTTGEEAFVSAHGKDLFSLYQERPESAEAFTKCMKSIFFTANPATMAEYDFSQHSVFLDYGGGMGAATTAVLYLYDQKARSNSKLTKAYVFDLPEVIKHGKITHPLVEYRGGSFFEPETIPTGVDVILINGVLHDWNDDECAQILTNAKNVLIDGGRIVVSDAAIPPEVGQPLYWDIARLDVFMMTSSSGFFRTAKEYEALWPKAGLRVVEIRPTRTLNTLWILSKQ